MGRPRRSYKPADVRIWYSGNPIASGHNLTIEVFKEGIKDRVEETSLTQKEYDEAFKLLQDLRRVLKVPEDAYLRSVEW